MTVGFIFFSLFSFEKDASIMSLWQTVNSPGIFKRGDPPPRNNDESMREKLTWKPGEVAQREPSWPKMEALLTLPVLTKLSSTYDCQDMMIDVCVG